MLDLVGSEEVLGKPPGSDLREGVLTLPAIEAIRLVPALSGVVSGAGFPDWAERVRSMIVASGAVESTLAEVRTRIADACQALSRLPDTDMRYVAPLMTLAESVLERGLTSAHAAMPEPLLDVVRQWRGDALTSGATRPIGGYR